VAATSANDVWAAGNYDTSTGQAKTLVLHWNGTSWTRVASPAPAAGSVLRGVAATSSSNAWAVGNHHVASTNTNKTLVLHWNGTSWARTAAPSPGGGKDVFNGLQGVSALSATDAWAVGACTTQFTDSLILHWNGTSWVPS
jgi:hypothetical protein